MFGFKKYQSGGKVNNKYIPDDSTTESFNDWLDNNILPRDKEAWTNLWKKAGSPYIEVGNERSHYSESASWKKDSPDTVNVQDQYYFDRDRKDLKGNIWNTPQRHMLHELGHAFQFNTPALQNKRYPTEITDLPRKGLLDRFLSRLNPYHGINPETNRAYIDSLNRKNTKQYYNKKGEEDFDRYGRFGTIENQAVHLEGTLSNYLIEQGVPKDSLYYRMVEDKPEYVFGYTHPAVKKKEKSSTKWNDILKKMQKLPPLSTDSYTVKRRDDGD
jgi:hypothetical protein